MKKSLIAALLVSTFAFASNAMAHPEITVSGDASGITDVNRSWDDNGTPDDYSDDTITVDFYATQVPGTFSPSYPNIMSTSVWVFQPAAYITPPADGQPYTPDPLNPDNWMGDWSALHDTSRGDFLTEDLGGGHYRMVADAVGFGGTWTDPDTGVVYENPVDGLETIHEPQGFFIGYWDGNGNPNATPWDDDFPDYYKIMSDGTCSIHGGGPIGEGAEIYPGSASGSSWEFSAAPVPEPASLLLLGSGLFGLGFLKRKED